MDEAQFKIAGLLVSALTPLAIVLAGYFINRSIKSREHEMVALRRKQDIRKEIYDEIGQKLNQIFCYICDVGDYGLYEPAQIIQFKRDLDRKFHVYRKLWSEKTVRAFNDFIGSAFQPFAGGTGSHARIRATTVEKKAFFQRVGRNWDSNWDKLFTAPDNMADVFSLYDKLVEAFAEDITETTLD